MKLAVTGKGGVGKTTIAGTLARALAHDQQRVLLALDADSNPTGEQPGHFARPHGNADAPAADLTEWREDASGKAYVYLRQTVPEIIRTYGVTGPDGACCS